MMAAHEEEAHLLPDIDPKINMARASTDSISSGSVSVGSVTSLVFEGVDLLAVRGVDDGTSSAKGRHAVESSSRPYADDAEGSAHQRNEDDSNDDYDLETGPFLKSTKALDKKFRRLIWLIAALFIGIWAAALFIYVGRHASRQAGEYSYDPSGASLRGNGKKITLEQVQFGEWRSHKDQISWIEGSHGEDGLLLERGTSGKGYLVVKDVREGNKSESSALATQILMKDGQFRYEGMDLVPKKVWPSKDLKKILIATDDTSNWRHSFYAQYWIFDVDTQEAEPLDPTNLSSRVQLASWSPQSDAVVFTRDNNMYLRKLSSKVVIPITDDGGPELFYGVPDWVYEEEVFASNAATWWSEDGKYIAFLRTDESAVPEYPVQFFVSRPSGKKPLPGEENYPEVREIKYPKAGAPNPIVRLQFFDVEKGDVFEVKISDEFSDDDRLITEVIWAGLTGKVLIRETNRESDILRVVLVDVLQRTGKTVRTVNVAQMDGGWFEVSHNTRFIPSDVSNGRPLDGYIDTVIHENYDHLGYFSPLDNPNPILLTSGKWEVVNAPSTVDLKNNFVYFVATKESPIQRHVYSVKLDGTDLQPLTDVSKEGYYGVSFSSGASYALLSYDGPNIPWQKVMSTRSNTNHFEQVIQKNERLANMTKIHALPVNIYSTVNIDGVELQVVERRPSNFNENKKYPVLFYLYGGPGSQTVNKVFNVDFQSYIAANLGYIVVTVDGRGTGYIGREARCIIRGNLGYWESRDQIETAKIWASKKYVDESRMAIWGWSYGGFMTLKTLEQDAGQTFSYGMAVAPVTDWRFYDSIYTERYMHTPQHNLAGYENATISNMTALQQNVRFLMMHGVADDNVHMQNSLTLIDKLDVAGVENYDVHVFPDSDHSIYFHNANKMVYDKLNNWLINAFNGEWLKTMDAVPKEFGRVHGRI